MKFLFAIFFFCGSFFFKQAEKIYIKKYEDGLLTSEGWISNGEKTGYWKYYDNGTLISQGHYQANRKNGYWHFYDEETLKEEGLFKNDKRQNWWVFHDYRSYRTVKKQYVDNQISGYVLYYKMFSLSKVEEYKSNLKIGEWTSYWSFKAAHPDFSLKELRR